MNLSSFDFGNAHCRFKGYQDKAANSTEPGQAVTLSMKVESHSIYGA